MLRRGGAFKFEENEAGLNEPLPAGAIGGRALLGLKSFPEVRVISCQ